MYKIALTLMALIVWMTVFAQNNEPERKGKSDPKAEAILDKVSNKYRSYKTIRAVFTLEIKSPESGLSEEKTGNIYIKGDKFKLSIGSQKIITDNTTLWTYLKDANEVQINYYNPEEGSISPSDIFTIYEKDFLYRLRDQITNNGKTYQVIELTPRNKEKSYYKILLHINDDNQRIAQAKIFGKNGTNYLYNINKFKTNLNLSNGFFKFDPDKHPDITVNDIR